MNILELIGQYLSDAQPAGLFGKPKPAPEPMKLQGLLDAYALSQVPGVSDVAGLLGDAKRMYDDPQERTVGNALWALAGGLPLIPSLGAIKVFHGSPHKFDKFDSKFIGTGEGAQAYAHGLYHAEGRGTAETYKRGLSDSVVRVDGSEFTHKDFPRGDPRSVAFSYLTAARDAQSSDPFGHARKSIRSILGKNSSIADDAIKALDDWQLRGAKVDEGGYLYESSLRWPDAAREAKDPLGPQHFLDWDKPLSEQSKEVQNLIERTGLAHRASPQAWVEPRGSKFHVVVDGKVERHLFNTKDDAEAFAAQVRATPKWYGAGKTSAPQTGADFYQNKTNAPTTFFDKKGWMERNAMMSKELAKSGIPGITYLDAGSRSAGQGTRNYVTFDDNLIELLKRNGEPLR